MEKYPPSVLNTFSLNTSELQIMSPNQFLPALKCRFYSLLQEKLFTSIQTSREVFKQPNPGTPKDFPLKVRTPSSFISLFSPYSPLRNDSELTEGIILTFFIRISK